MYGDTDVSGSVQPVRVCNEIHTRPSTLPVMASTALPINLAIPLPKSGSNLAESISLSMIREIVIPSLDPGGCLYPPEKAALMLSVIRPDERER